LDLRPAAPGMPELRLDRGALMTRPHRVVGDSLCERQILWLGFKGEDAQRDRPDTPKHAYRVSVKSQYARSLTSQGCDGDLAWFSAPRPSIARQSLEILDYLADVNAPNVKIQSCSSRRGCENPRAKVAAAADGPLLRVFAARTPRQDSKPGSSMTVSHHGI